MAVANASATVHTPRRRTTAAPAAPLRPVTLETIERDCRDHFAVACERLLKIKPKDASLTPFTLNWPQRYVVERYLQPAFEAKEPLVLFILKGRQDGLSTLGMGWTYHKIRWFPGITAIAAAHTDDTVSNFRDMAQRFHENLPPEMQPPKDRYNRKEIHYLPPLDSSLRVRAAKYLDISRGKTPHIVILSEAAYYPDPETIMAGVTESVPDYGPTLILIESTAAGIDTWHYDTWRQIGRDAKLQQWSRRKWQRVFLPWYWSPDKTMAFPARWDFPLEDRQEFRDIQTRYKLRDEQIMWYWSKYQEYCKTHGHLARRLLRQEQPTNPKEAFITGGECVFPESAMKALEAHILEPRQGFGVKRTGTWTMTLVSEPLRSEPPLLVWEGPQAGKQYALGVDVSRGIGRDASAIVVVRMPGFVQVAHWSDTTTSTKDLAYVIAAIATWYAKGSGDRPICTVELNDAGIHTNMELQELSTVGPFQMYIWEYMDRLGAQPVTHQSKTGWVTSVATKPIMLGVANSLLLAGQCMIPSADLQVDMGRCQEILRYGKSYGETGGRDLTIAWLLAIITAWRKIARWALPGHETNRPGQPLLDIDHGIGDIPAVFFDRHGEEILGRQASTASVVRAGAPEIDWRIQ